MTHPAINTGDFKEILDKFSAQFHQNFAGEHRVGSPLGAWCLLAFVAADTKNPASAVLKNLGCTPSEAKHILLTLLKEKPDVVALAVNSWINPEAAALKSFTDWIADVKEFNATTVTIPGEEELNSWVDKESLGLINSFPVNINPEDFLGLFATVIATDIKWDAPFDVETHHELNDIWKVENFLYDNRTGNTFLHKDKDLGLFAVHKASTGAKDLSVYSVIAVDESVSEADTMAVARKIATGGESKVKLDTLELGVHGDGALELIATKSSDLKKPSEQHESWLPAWKTSNKYGLNDAGLGFVESCERFNDVEQKTVFTQVALAEYNATGFKAAALTFGIVMRSASIKPYKDITLAVVKFNRPYAVVATAYNETGIWDNIPVFDGWITEAVEAEV